MSPRRNRVTPFGTLSAVPERGMFMGNRGNLRTPGGGLKPWRARGWICCATAFGGRRIDLDDPRRYTALFFFDEAVALAAGHRPCAECRHAAYHAFKDAYRRARGLPEHARLAAGDMDRELHAARIHKGRQITHRAALRDLPTGTFAVLDARPDQALLVAQGALYPWSFAGYAPALAVADTTEVTVLTPRPLVDVLAAGYIPALGALPGRG